MPKLGKIFKNHFFHRIRTQVHKTHEGWRCVMSKLRNIYKKKRKRKIKKNIKLKKIHIRKIKLLIWKKELPVTVRARCEISTTNTMSTKVVTGISHIVTLTFSTTREAPVSFLTSLTSPAFNIWNTQTAAIIRLTEVVTRTSCVTITSWKWKTSLSNKSISILTNYFHD